MSAQWRDALDRWLAAGLLDEAAAARIRAWETGHATHAGRSRLSAIIFGLGGLLLAAGVLLFVAAHWDDISPGSRFALVMAMVAVLHLGGAFTSDGSPALSTTLHAVGTAALGAGIFLAGQIFNLAEHWPGALLLWVLGAAAGLCLLRDWPHVLWVAVLAPAWLCSEWIVASEGPRFFLEYTVIASGVTLLAVAYLAAAGDGRASVWRRALTRLGAVALIPAVILLGASHERSFLFELHPSATRSAGWLAVAWIIAIALPSILIFLLRGRQAVWFAAAVAWVLVVGQFDWSSDGGELAFYALCALGAAGVVYWGLKDQQRLHVNVGIFGFALAIAAFYFSSLFDKLGRSLGLIGMGVLFIGGGWLLERTRRTLVERIDGNKV